MLNMVDTFKAIYKEHGLNETLRRLNRLFNLNISNVKKIEFKDNIITFVTENPVTITVEKDYYLVTKVFKGYKSLNYYDNDRELFRQSVIFSTEDYGLLGVDSFCGGPINSTRIMKTTEDDPDFLEPYFSREVSTITDLIEDERSRYTEFSNEDIEKTKEIDLEDNYYYYNLTCDEEKQCFIETAACLNTPTHPIYGTTNNTRDLLYYAEQSEYPSIQFRGSDIDKYGSIDKFFDVVASKLPGEGLISLQVDQINQIDGSMEHFNHLLPNMGSGPISIKDILLLSYFIESLGYSFGHHLVDSLNKLKDKMLIKEYRKMPDYDPIELTLRMYPDFNELAFKVYENLATYNDVIKRLSHRDFSVERQKTFS